MKKYSFRNFWQGFNEKENYLIDYLKNYTYVSLTDSNDKSSSEYSESCTIEEIDFIIIGSFIESESDYYFIKNLTCKKILYLTEPVYYMYPYVYQLFTENTFDYVFGTIENKITNFYKIPLYFFWNDVYLKYKQDDFFNKINQKIKENNDFSSKKTVCLINSHDNFHTRTQIYHAILDKNIDIDCAGQLFNNCPALDFYINSTVDFIEKYWFNICTENSIDKNIPGYITEKLMNCCLAGAIPIYSGWFDEIDARIFNKNRILFYHPDDDVSVLQVANTVYSFLENEDALLAFYQQDIFMDTAAETLLSMEQNLSSFFSETLEKSMQ